MEKLGLNLGFLIVQILNFAIIMVVLRAWVYKPLLGALQKRRATIEQGLEDARVAAAARANAEKEAEGILAEAQVKAAKVIREAKDKAMDATREVKIDAEAEIVRMRNAALSEIGQERERELSEIRTHVASLAIAAAQKLIGESLDEKRQHALVAEFFSGIKDGTVVVLEGTEMSGIAAEVYSALPLTETEQKTIRGDVLGKLGKNAEITFNVDPAILGGLVVRVGDKVIDGSVAGQIQNLRHSLE